MYPGAVGKPRLVAARVVAELGVHKGPDSFVNIRDYTYRYQNLFVSAFSFTQNRRSPNVTPLNGPGR